MVSINLKPLGILARNLPESSKIFPFEEVKVPVSNSAEFVQKSAPWGILEDLGWLGLMNSIWE